MKKLIVASLLFVSVRGWAVNPIMGTVQISTNPIVVPKFQNGSINIASGTIHDLNVSFGLSVGTMTVSTLTVTNLSVSTLTVTSSTTLSATRITTATIVNSETVATLTVSSNTVLPGATFYQAGPIILGNPSQSVTISSNTILPGATFYQGSPIIFTSTVTFLNAPFSNWISWTPAFTGLGSATNINFFWRRVGDTMEVQGIATAGTVTGSNVSFSLPNSLVTNGTVVKALNAGGDFSIVGVFGVKQNSTNFTAVLADAGDNLIFFGSGSAGGSSINVVTGSSGFTSGATFTVFARIPISGWSF